MRHRVLAAGLLTLLTCRSPSGVADLTPVRVRDCDGPASSLPSAIAATLPPRTGNMMPDDQWADLAAEVPGGFAGVLYVEGKPVLMLTRPEEAAEAKAALAGRIAGFPVADAEVRRARWDFAQLVDWFNYLWPHPNVHSPGMVSGDKNEATNRIAFGVLDAHARANIVEALVGLGIPCDLVLVEITPPIVTR